MFWALVCPVTRIDLDTKPPSRRCDVQSTELRKSARLAFGFFACRGYLGGWRMFRFLGRVATGHPWIILACWFGLAVFAGFLAPNWDRNSQDDDIRYLPPSCASVRGYQLLEEAFPKDSFACNLVYVFERQDRPLDPKDLALVEGVVRKLEKLRTDEPALQIRSIASPKDSQVGKKLASLDGYCHLVRIQLNCPYLAAQTRLTVDNTNAAVKAALDDYEGMDPLVVYASGPAGIGHDLIQAGTNSLENTTVATILLVVGILLFVYRAPVMVLIPLFTIALSVFVALKCLAMLTVIPGFRLANVSQLFAVVMLYGAGTDYCLFLISRYREELAEGRPMSSALERSLGNVGHALAASAGTVIFSLGLMGTAEFLKIRSGGPAIALSLVVAFLASITLTPALLRLCGRWAFWPGEVPGRGFGRFHDLIIDTGTNRGDSESFWEKFSRSVSARPGIWWMGGFLALLPFAILGCFTQASYRATAELRSSSPSIQGLQAIQRHFPAGEAGPITVFLESERSFDSEEGRNLIEHLSQGFLMLEHVAEVRAVTRPLGQAIPEVRPDYTKKNTGSFLTTGLSSLRQGIDQQVRKAASQHYNAVIEPADDKPRRHVTRLEVVLDTDPFDPQSIPVLGRIQAWLGSELPVDARNFGAVRAETYGITVGADDLARVTESDRRRINILVLVAVLLILLALVRDILLASYLLASVVFSYLSTLGATMLLAHYGFHRPFGEVDWRVPLFLFVILVAVGEDYNILLISRMVQERKRNRPAEAMRRALAATGSTITSCGLIMAGTFATLMLAGLNTMVQIGFALAFGVLIDTFVVRPILVPALCMVWWRRKETSSHGIYARDMVTLPPRKAV